MNLLEILKFAEEYLNKYSFSKPRLEAEKIISYCLGLERVALYLNHERILAEDEKDSIKYFLKKITEEKVSFDMLEKEKIDFKSENLEIFNKSIDYLRKNGVENPRLDVEYIFSNVLSVSRNMLNMNLGRKINETSKNKIREMLIERGKKRKPLQYILGEWEFYGHPFKVDERALIPRQDTEILIEQCKELIYNNFDGTVSILDIGCGSGAISISLAKEIPTAEVLGIDISPKAISLANENKELNAVTNVNFILSNLFENIKDKKFNLIVSNPPYISLDEYKSLMPELKYEPRNALTDEGDGLTFYKKICELASNFLLDNSYLIFEIGYNQAEALKSILEKNNFHLLSLVKDYGGNDRVVIAKYIKKVDDFNVNKS